MSDIVYAKYPWDGKCPRCSGTKLQDGTSAGSCWEHICRECNAHFDDPPDPADSEEPSQSNPTPAEVTAEQLCEVFVEMSDGIMWKEPEADGHFYRAAKKLNALLAAAKGK